MNDKDAEKLVLAMFASGKSTAQMTQGTGLKRSRVEKILARLRSKYRKSN